MSGEVLSSAYLLRGKKILLRDMCVLHAFDLLDMQPMLLTLMSSARAFANAVRCGIAVRCADNKHPVTIAYL